MERRPPPQESARCPLAAADLTADETFAARRTAADFAAVLTETTGFAEAFAVRCLRQIGEEKAANRLPCFVPRKEETENFAEQLLIDFVSVLFVCLPTDPGGDVLPRRSGFLF